jgi:hypothetical protein
LSPEVDLTTAIVTAIQALAWPVAVFGGVWLLRQEIRALLERISQIKYKDLEIFVREGLGRTREVLRPELESEDVFPLMEGTGETKDVGKLIALAARSPRDAIIDSWNLTRNLLVETAKSKSHHIPSLPINVPYAVGAAWFLHSKKLIPDSVMAAVQNLAAIHAKVSDNPDFQPTVDDAQQFVLYSASVREDLAKIS